MKEQTALDRALRESGIKMKFVAEQTGISMQTLSSLRNRQFKRDLYLWEACAIAKVLGVSVEKLNDLSRYKVSDSLIDTA
jgi:lambda repressor-like predicted transcriptional regulator